MTDDWSHEETTPTSTRCNRNQICTARQQRPAWVTGEDFAGFESAYCDFYQRKSPAQLIGRFLR
jgi:hypothetical protein